MAELNWSDSQWQRVNDAVTEAFSKASVASAFLPMYGPLSGSSEVVRNERIEVATEDNRPILRLDKSGSAVNQKLLTLTVNVELSSEQVADETLSNALLVFRRAANILALQQDGLVFNGYPDSDVSKYLSPEKEDKAEQEIQRGLADSAARANFVDLIGLQNRDVKFGFAAPQGAGTLGQAVVSGVVKSMNDLERRSNPSPFACVLGDTLYEAVHDPSASLVLPADRITPMLKGGPLLRSGKINKDVGVVVSLAANVIDLVIGTPPTAQFLQRTSNAKFLFRVYLRSTLRIRDTTRSPVAGFQVKPVGAPVANQPTGKAAPEK